ncbi:cytochrome P450 [Penicillium riverlandense]|uniref:cytochrome P450 n=1 Tax=Penicillium riverlandense TaxID=1903569 RepID=UPI0025481B90|nr:cytochrome P450 [Penicillium riverlandense]KAJ5819620.1 cytochrome P450 [Penicillium riverlandense]
MPFGGGSRICIGMHLARMELRLATALFFRAFPQAYISTKEGMTENDMHIKASFLMGPQGHRCLIEA